MVLDFIQILFINSCVIYLMFLLGQFFSPLLFLGNSTEGKISNLFHSVLSGMILMVIIYSIWKTGGVTINWIFVIVQSLLDVFLYVCDTIKIKVQVRFKFNNPFYVLIEDIHVNIETTHFANLNQ